MEANNIEQLKKLAKVFNTANVITSDEIEQVLSGILSIMSSFKKDNENLTKETRDYVNELLDKVIEEKNILKSDTEVKANEISKDVQAKLDSKLEEVKKLIKEAKALKPKNGKDADQVKIVKDVLSQIKLPEYKPTLLDTPEEIKNKLETLTGDERLDISAIKGADKLATQANLERGISILDQRTQFLINKTNSSSGSSITLKTNNVDNGSQSILNLKQGANITLTDDGVGGVTIDAAGGSGTPGGSTTQLQYNNAGSFGGISGVTTNGTAVTFTGGSLLVSDVKASSSAGVTIKNNSGTAVADFGTGSSTNSSIHGSINIGVDSADYIQFIGGTGNATENLVGSSTDIDKVIVPKGAGKFKVTGNANISGLTALQILATNASKDLVSLDTATYPSLTELSYVKGVTSSIQTQINSKQATLTLGTGVQTALGVNVGTAGAFVVNGGALGTPSSGTVTNLTGTASININGTVGATTPTTGAFTTATANSFVPNLSTIPSNGMYLPAANTLGWAINSAAELQLTATALSPAADGGNSLGTTALGWQNLFANTGFVLNIENSDWVATHTTGILTVGTGDLRVTTAGTNTASVVTVGGTQTLTAKTLTTPVINGVSTGTGVATAATASTLVLRDSNANISFNNWLGGYATTATAAGTTTLTVASAYLQYFTGSTTQTVTMPVTSTLTLGHEFRIVNNSTGAVTVNSSGGNAILIVAAGTSAIFDCILTSGTTAASWSYSYVGIVSATGKKLTVSNTMTLAGTDGTTLTMPSATDTIVGRTSTDTLTNKRIQPRTASSTTSSNLSPDLATANVYYRTTQTATLTIDAPTGTPVIGETIMIYVDSAGAQTLTINATYVAFGAAFPATTTAGKTFMMSAQYNGTNWKTLWAVAQ